MKNMIVIEDFYKNPQAVRDYALNKVKYMTPEQLNPEFAGTESQRGVFSPEVIQKIEKALGQNIEVNPQQFAFGVFSKTYASDESKKCVHVDGSDWTAVLFLSRPEDCQGGTVFYEHKDLGWNEVPSLETLQSKGYSSREEFIEGDLKKDSRDFSKWKVSARVGMKFNRLVLFRSGTMFHAAEGYFGSEDQDCRLLQLFFFKTKGA
jgi:hypothetical protein